MTFPPKVTQSFLRLAFWATITAAFIAAEMPAKVAPHLLPWDKAQHFAAFYVLTVLGSGAYPRRRLLLLGACLSAFGALIELAQGIPIIHRDPDIWDWAADTIAVLTALIPVGIPALRRYLRQSTSLR